MRAGARTDGRLIYMYELVGATSPQLPSFEPAGRPTLSPEMACRTARTLVPSRVAATELVELAVREAAAVAVRDYRLAAQLRDLQEVPPI